MARLYNASEVISFLARDNNTEEICDGSDDELEMENEDVDETIDDGKYKKYNNEYLLKFFALTLK